jgi:hypothetical protein
MKNSIITKCLAVALWLCVLAGLVAVNTGCLAGSPGETRSEVHRRHMRVINTDKQQRQDDIDAVLLLNKPSRLTEKPIR